MSHIGDYAAGDDFDIVRQVTDLPAGTTLVGARLMIKKHSDDADGDALVDLAITSATTTEGTITDDGTADGEADMTFHVPAADSATLSPTRDYVWGIKIELNNGYSGHYQDGTIRMRYPVVAGSATP